MQPGVFPAALLPFVFCFLSRLGRCLITTSRHAQCKGRGERGREPRGSDRSLASGKDICERPFRSGRRREWIGDWDQETLWMTARANTMTLKMTQRMTQMVSLYISLDVRQIDEESIDKIDRNVTPHDARSRGGVVFGFQRHKGPTRGGTSLASVILRSDNVGIPEMTFHFPCHAAVFTSILNSPLTTHPSRWHSYRDRSIRRGDQRCICIALG
jgi:hypothetical protein